MTVTSSSTLAQVQAAMRDNASYAIHDSLTECQDYIVAANNYLVMAAEGMVHGGRGGGEELRLGVNLEILERSIRTATAWQAGRSNTARRGAVYADLSGMRE